MAISDEWKIWIWDNISRDVSRDVIAYRLVDQGFDPKDIFNELGVLPANRDLDIQHTIASLQCFGAKRVEHDSFILFVLDTGLSLESCEHLMHLIKEDFVESSVVERDVSLSSGRKSKTRFLESCLDKTVVRLKVLISGFLGIPYCFSEPLQGQWYESGGFYNQHYDTFDSTQSGYDQHFENQGQRTWTFMINLNSPDEGGETLFSKVGHSFSPKPGQAVIWYNLQDNGQRNPYSLHGGNPVIRGEKLIITSWFQQRARALF